MNIIEHLEGHLGEISRGWKDPVSPSGIRVVSFKDQPFEDIITYSTLGLSNTILPMNNGKSIRQELVFSAYRNFNNERIASFLSTFAEYLISINRALLRGDYIGPEAPIVLGTLLNSVYSAIPVIYKDSISVFDHTSPPTVIAWVIPIHEKEANYIRANGWSKFEDLLEEEDPELWDLTRSPIV